MLYSIPCLWHQCMCLFIHVDVPMENKGRGEKAPPCGQKWKRFVTSTLLYVRSCVNRFNYLACCLSVCGIILTGIVIESLCQYWSTYSGSCPILHADQSQTQHALFPSKLIDESRLSMADNKDSFILNPIKMVWFSLCVCVFVEERQRKRIMEAEWRRSLCPLFKNIFPVLGTCTGHS